MNEALVADIEISDSTLEESNNNYLGTVSELGDTEEITAGKDIYTDQGVLLLKKGTLINRKTYSTLIKHRLKDTVDSSLAVADTLTNSQLYDDLKEQLENDPSLVQMALAIPNHTGLHQCLQHIFINEQLRNKVTIAKKSHPKLYTHSLRVSINAAIMGFYLGLSRDDCDCLATAGLLHDLGHMHMDSSIMQSNQLLLPKQKQIIYAHPVIMYMLLKDSDTYHPKISMPILEHHERTWGTGYPRGISTYHSKLSAVLAMTEVIASMTEKHSIARVFTVLRSHDNTFDKDLISAIVRASKSMTLAVSDNKIELELSTEYLSLISSVLAEWDACYQKIQPELSNHPLLQQINVWIYGIQKAIDRCGIDLHADQPLMPFADDPVVLEEVHNHLDELLYTLGEILDSLDREKMKNRNSIANDNHSLAEWIDSLQAAVRQYKSTIGLSVQDA